VLSIDIMKKPEFVGEPKKVGREGDEEDSD
jgi:hypothetical protein